MKSTAAIASDTHQQHPLFLNKAAKLANYVSHLDVSSTQTAMHVSPALAESTHNLMVSWLDDKTPETVALDSFIGDVYSGLRPADFDDADRIWMNNHVGILSGLYGLLRPLDLIKPYRLEMGYKFNNKQFSSLYRYWGDLIASTLPKDGYIINASSVEYMKVITPFIDKERIITPRFMSINPKTNQPVFVAVHSKIARGAYARWIVFHKDTPHLDLSDFDDLGYSFIPEQSTASSPLYVCKKFGGIGLSIRLTGV